MWPLLWRIPTVALIRTSMPLRSPPTPAASNAWVTVIIIRPEAATSMALSGCSASTRRKKAAPRLVR